MKRALCLAGILAGAGCGLVDSDVTDIDISLPEREVTVDTADWQLSSTARLQDVDCSQDQQICSTGLAELSRSLDDQMRQFRFKRHDQPAPRRQTTGTLVRVPAITFEGTDCTRRL